MVSSVYPSPCWHKYNFKKIKWINIKTGPSLVYCKPLVGKTDTKGTEQSETMYLTLDLTTISLGGKMDVSRNSDDYQVWYELLQPFPFRGQVELKMSMLNVYAFYNSFIIILHKYTPGSLYYTSFGSGLQAPVRISFGTLIMVSALFSVYFLNSLDLTPTQSWTKLI